LTALTGTTGDQTEDVEIAKLNARNAILAEIGGCEDQTEDDRERTIWMSEERAGSAEPQRW